MALARKMTRISRVVKAYTVAYADPIAFRAGETLSVGRRDTEWPQFVWCTSAEGKSGWVADSVFERHGTVGIASRDYSAVELAVSPDEIVTIDDEYGGWSWCTNHQGRSGWVPDTHLAK